MKIKFSKLAKVFLSRIIIGLRCLFSGGEISKENSPSALREGDESVRLVERLRHSVSLYTWHFAPLMRICGAAILLLSLFSSVGFAQNSTVVTVNTTDTQGIAWFGGTYTVNFVGPQQVTWPGGSFARSFSGTLNSLGNFSLTLPSNTTITPTPTFWTITTCPFPTLTQASNFCTTQQFTISGSQMAINFTPPPLQIPGTATAPVAAYADAEIVPNVSLGFIYYQAQTVTTGQYRICQVINSLNACTLWGGFGSGPPPTGFPRLDQIPNQNQPKTFNQGGAALGFTAGPGLNLSGETSPLTVPVIVSCATSAPGQICDDGTNYHIFVNGVDTLLVFSSSTILSGNNGDVAGYKVSAGQVSLQDLGPVNAQTGSSFLNINVTSPLDGDLAAWNAFGPPFWVNATPGAADTSINGATNAYTISFSDQLTTIDHDVAGSVSVTVTLPTATTLGINPGFVFSYSNHSTHADTITPTTWTINGAASLPVPANTVCNKVRVDPNSATNWLAECANITGGSPGGGITSINTVATGPAVTIQGAGSAGVATSGNTITVTGINGPPSPTVQTNATGAYTVQNSDNTWRNKFTSAGAVAITQPQANTIGVSPFINTPYFNTPTSGTTVTTGNFAQSAGNNLVVMVGWNGTTTVVGTPIDAAGDSFTRVSGDITNIGASHQSVSVWKASSIAASASNNFSITFSGTTAPVIAVEQYLLQNFDNSTGASNAGTGQSLTASVPLSYSQEVVLGFFQGQDTLGCPQGYVNRGTGSTTAVCEKLFSASSNALFNYQTVVDPAVIELAGWQIASQPVFTAGWYDVVEDYGANLDTITPTVSTINGQTTLVEVPNEWCAPMSDGINYNAICGFMPNVTTNGIMGGAVEIAGRISNNISTDITATTLITTGATDAAYKVEASLTCRGAVAGQPTLTITWTDTSNTVQTVATSGVDCTALGGASSGSISRNFRAKASTNIQVTTTHANTQPTYDVDVSILMRHTQ